MYTRLRAVEHHTGEPRKERERERERVSQREEERKKKWGRKKKDTARGDEGKREDLDATRESIALEKVSRCAESTRFAHVTALLEPPEIAYFSSSISLASAPPTPPPSPHPSLVRPLGGVAAPSRGEKTGGRG